MSTGAITPQKVADLRADLVERLDTGSTPPWWAMTPCRCVSATW